MNKNDIIEEKIIKSLMKEALILLKSDLAVKLSKEYIHSRHGVLFFKLEIENINKDGLTLVFSVALDLNSYCRTRLVTGKKIEVISVIEKYIFDITPIKEDLPNYYRILFDNN
ncbi:hypothetical protein [Aquimarina algiphila]|uniref:hypothetical protein n=1 Tax=Aquimarina algiphila TaxID=2047982 RepID=UPI00232E9A99|nr:hypothetical protein [Aquimarina algiphila]